MKNLITVFILLALMGSIGSCAAKKATISKEKQHQIDKDKRDFEKNVQ